MEDEYNHVKSEDEYTLTMYKICPKDKNLNLCYVGQTADFNNRKRQHIRNTSNIEDKKHYHLKHYDAIRNNGGWDEWEMVEIEKFTCKTKLEARTREQELIKEYNANLNSVSAFVTEDERKSTKNAATEKYREENKELLKEQTKKYKQEHKEIIAEQMKIYRQENKEKIKEKTKEYRENNKEKYQETQKDWREKNKEILKEKRKIYEAKKKQEKLAKIEEEKLNSNEPILTEEEIQLKKEQHKKEKRDQYNANRRLKRQQEKEQDSKSVL